MIMLIDTCSKLTTTILYLVTEVSPKSNSLAVCMIGLLLHAR